MAFQNIVKKVTTAAAFILMAGGITCFSVSAAQSGYQKISAECGEKEFTVTGILPKGTTLSVERCNDSAYKDAVVDLEGKEHFCDADVYDISLKDANGKEFEPGRNVNVTFADAEENLDNSESVSVYHFEGDDADRAEKLRVRRAGEDAVVKTNSFSKFAVVRRAAAVKTVTLDTGNNINKAMQALNADATAIVFTRTAPTSGVTTKDISSGGGVVAYLDGSTINIYVPATYEKASLNDNSVGMFFRMSKVTKIQFNDLIDTSAVTSMADMFEGCSSLTSLNVTNFDTSKVTNMSMMFDGCTKLSTLDLSKFNTANVTNMFFMFEGCSSLTSLNITNFDTSKVTDMSYMFEGCSSLTSLNVTNFDTSKVTDMIGMFSGCTKLSTLDVSKFNTANVTNVSQMFLDCSSLTSLNVTSFDTSEVTNMSMMFYGCTKLSTLDVSKFNTANVTAMDGMFNGCSSLTSLNVANFDTSNVTYMYSMFSGCSSLTSLNITNFDISKVRWLSDMFSGCSALTSLNVTNLDTSKVAWMDNMFRDCSSLTSLNVTNFDTSNVTNMSNMFSGCSSLTSLNITNFDTSEVTNMSGMLQNNLRKIELGSSFVVPANATNVFPSPTTAYSGKASNGTWGLDSEHAATTYSATDLATKGQTKGALAGTWYAQISISKITFDANGGTGTTASVTATYGEAMPAITNGMSRTGYTFTGYYDATSGGTKYYNANGSSARTWNKTANATLYAQWTLTPYKFDVNPQSHVTGFRLKKNNADADGGTSIGDYYADAYMGDKFYLYSPTFATGYEFSSFTKQYGPGNQTTSGSTATVTMGAGAQAIAINAKATTYSISYNANGGTLSGQQTSYTIESATITLPTPTRTGYTFTGWTGSNGTTPQTTVTIPKGSYGNKSYTANWKANTNTKYTVIHQQEQLDGTYKTVETQNLTGTTDTKVTPAVKSYTGFTSPATQTINIAGAGNTVVTYKYARNTYTITRQYRLENADGTFTGYSQIDSKKYKYGASIAAWNRAADTTYKAASIAAYTVTTKNDTLSVNVMRNTSTNNAIQYRLQNADGSYPSTYTAAWSGTLRYGESHTWNYAQTASHQATSKAVSYNGGTVNVNVPRRTGRLVIHANGGTGDRNTTAILYGASAKINPMPSRTGYTLTGLYTAASGGTKVVNADGTMTNDGTYSKSGAWLLNSDANVYAQWTVNQYTVTCEDWFVDASNNRKVKLGSSTKQMAYGTTASGTAWGADGKDSKYHYGYVYKSATSATVGTSGATVYRYFWAWTGLNVYYAGGTTQNGATVSFKVGNGTWSDVTNEINTVQPYGATYYLKNIRPIHEYEEFSRVENLTYDSTNGYYTYTPTYGGTSMVVYLKYKTYSLTYNLNGGSVSGNPTSYNYSTASFTLKNPTRTGYTFTGWTGSNGITAQTSVTVAKGSYGNKSYTANWSANKYTVSFNANGGSGTTASVSATYNSNMPAITNGMSRTGYTFTGYYDAASGGTKYYNADGSSAHVWDKTADTTLYAQWTLTPYKFDVNPQSHVTGFRLKKNNADADGGTSIGDYYADAYMGDKFYLYSPTFATGYEFNGFSKSGPGSQTTSGSTATITMGAGAQAIAINAKPITYSISYNANGGTLSGQPTSYTIESAAITLPTPKRTGYTFTGWTGSNGTTAQTAVTIAAGSTGNKSYTAHWKALTTHVTLDMQGGKQTATGDSTVSDDGSTESFTCTYDETSYRYRTHIPTRTGYTFQGYFSKPNGAGEQVYTKDGLAMTGSFWSSQIWKYTGSSVTFYACWSANPYTVHFDANTGTGTMKDQILTYNQNGTLSANAFTKKGYSFIGWTTNADGTGKKFSDRDVVSNLVTSGSITLYAQWQKNPYTVTVPKKVQYQNMNAGNVNHTVSIPITVSGDFPGTVSVTSKPDTLTAPDGKTLNMETNSHKSAITFTAGDGTKNDALTITGTARLDKYSGIVQYSVSQTE